VPYIGSHMRGFIQSLVDLRAIHDSELEPGELNYLITSVCLASLPDDGPHYAAYNTVIGVLESVKIEFYRRMVAPYEDKKRDQHGEVYPIA